MVVDPACGMEVNPAYPGATAEYDGQTYYFCSEGCKDRFLATPEQYLESELHHLSELQGMTTPRIVSERTEGTFELSTEGEELSVGDEVRFTKTITDADVHQFAEITGDTNALHLNDAFAERTRFGHRIAHGTLVAGLISAALASFPGITTYLSQSLSFERPVDIGDTLTATCRIAENITDDRYCLTTRVENKDGKLVLHGTATVLIDEMPTLP